jgi:hypothetical protein
VTNGTNLSRTFKPLTPAEQKNRADGGTSEKWGTTAGEDQKNPTNTAPLLMILHTKAWHFRSFVLVFSWFLWQHMYRFPRDGYHVVACLAAEIRRLSFITKELG